MIVKMDEKKVMQIIADAKHQSDFVLVMYALVIPEWDKVKSMNGFPRTNKKTGIAIMQLAIDLDRKLHPEVLAGGMWMNNGFGSSNAEYLKDWQVEIDDASVEYEEEK